LGKNLKFKKGKPLTFAEALDGLEDKENINVNIIHNLNSKFKTKTNKGMMTKKAKEIFHIDSSY